MSGFHIRCREPGISAAFECRGHDWPKWRAHISQLIAEARVEFDNSRRPRQPLDFGVTLALHTPYTLPGGALQCLECLDGSGAGEFATTTDWARHVSDAMTKLGLRVGWKP